MSCHAGRVCFGASKRRFEQATSNEGKLGAVEVLEMAAWGAMMDTNCCRRKTGWRRLVERRNKSGLLVKSSWRWDLGRHADVIYC